MTPMSNIIDTHNVFVVHGRNLEARDSLFRFLRSIGLRPLEWSQAIQMTGKASPFIGEILDVAFSKAKAVVVLLTPDDVAQLKEQFRSPHDPPYEAQLTGQARPNVLFEAGMAIGRDPERTIIVELGTLRPFSDIAGRHTIRLSNSSKARQEVAQRLETAGCPVDLTGRDWHTEGDFSIKPDADSVESAKQNIAVRPAEQIIYDSRGGIDGFDFRGQESQLWTGVGTDAKAISPKGHGALKLEGGGILDVQRIDTDGRFEVWLQRFSFEGKEYSFIPKNLHISGKRKLRIGFDAKAVGGEHTLTFVIRIEEGYRLAEESVRVSASEWKPFEVFLQFDPTKDCQLRIDDGSVSKAPSSVQIRNIVVAERKA